MEARHQIEKKFCVHEWSIDNFSYWNKEVHDAGISASISRINFNLFPKGFSGNDEYLLVRLGCSEPIIFSGDLSIIGSDGSLLYWKHVFHNSKTNSLDICTELKFEKVAPDMRKNAILYKDRLTLRFRLRSPENSEVYKRTVIEVHAVSFKISPKFLNSLDSEDQIISVLQYHFDGDQTEKWVLEGTKSKKKKGKRCLSLGPVSMKKVASVIIRMHVLNNEKDIAGIAVKEHIFRQEDNWTFSSSLQIEEMIKNKSYLNLQVRIVPRIKITECFAICNIHPEVFVSMPTNDPKLSYESNSEERSSRSSTSTDSNQNDRSATMLAKELMSLYKNRNFSDLKLKCDSVSFPVHRAILSARSPVFKTMLSTNTREVSSGEVVIRDLEPSTLTNFLAFLYSGKVEDMECDRALKLYYAADKYQV